MSKLAQSPVLASLVLLYFSKFDTFYTLNRVIFYKVDLIVCDQFTKTKIFFSVVVENALSENPTPEEMMKISS